MSFVVGLFCFYQMVFLKELEKVQRYLCEMQYCFF